MQKTNQEKLDFWMARIMECRKSGLSDSGWCRQNGIAPSSLYYWIKKLRMEASEIPVTNHEMAVPFKQDVVPLHVVGGAQSLQEDRHIVHETAIVIRLEGISLEIQNGAHETTITNTINALRRLC